MSTRTTPSLTPALIAALLVCTGASDVRNSDVVVSMPGEYAKAIAVSVQDAEWHGGWASTTVMVSGTSKGYIVDFDYLDYEQKGDQTLVGHGGAEYRLDKQFRILERIQKL